MTNPQHAGTVHKLDDGIILQRLDDLCFVRLDGRSVDAARTRELGEKVVAFIEEAGCRKLVIEGVELIHGFLLDKTPAPSKGPHFKPETKNTASSLGSDAWLG